MFKIYNKSNRIVEVCSKVIPSQTASAPMVDAYYEDEKARIDKLVSMGIIQKIDMPEVDELELQKRQAEEARIALEQQEAENRRVEEETRREEEEARKIEEELAKSETKKESKKASKKEEK